MKKTFQCAYKINHPTLCMSTNVACSSRTPRKAVKVTPLRVAAPRFALPSQGAAKSKGTPKRPWGPFLPAGLTATEAPIRGPSPKPTSTTTSETETDASSAQSNNRSQELLYSPVKTSHDEIIDLTLSSSGSDDDSDADKREVVSLIKGSPPPLKRLVKGLRLPDMDKLSLKDEHTPRKGTSERIFYSDDEPEVRPATKYAPKASRERWAESSSDSEEDAPKTAPLVSRSPAPEKFPLARAPSPDHDTRLPSPEPPSPMKKGKASRMTKKAQRDLEQARREAYANQLFRELNASVFKGGLPEATTLKWSVRLLTTAGRAKWRRSRDGTQTTEIELATKVLDSDGKCNLGNCRHW